MIYHETTLRDAWLIDLERRGDERGCDIGGRQPNRSSAQNRSDEPGQQDDREPEAAHGGGHHRSGPGTGAVVAGAAAGLAVGAVGGFVAAEVIDEVFDDDDEDDD